MKTIHHVFRVSLMFFLCFLFVKLTFSQIQSTTSGGLWSDPNTWIGGVVPGTGDDVIINGPVQADNNSCNDLTVTSNGILSNKSNNNYSLNVGGDATNYGTIQNLIYNFAINLNGNLENHGTWTNNTTNLSGGDQSLTLYSPFGGYYLTNTNASGKITLLSNGFFNNTRIDMTNDTIVSDLCDTLSINNGYLKQAVFTKNNVKSPGLYLTVTNNAYIESSTITASGQAVTYQGSSSGYFRASTLNASNLIISGTIQIFGTCYFNADVVSSATLRNHSNYEYTCYVSGSFVNNGAVTNNNYSFNIYISGDVTNNGTWTNNRTYLNGTQDQTLNFIKPFGGSYLYNSEAAGKIILASNMFLNNTRVEMANDTIITDVCDTVSLNNGYIWQAKFIKNNVKSPGFHLSLSNGAY
ncbi:MAG: hypothetical protein JXA03_00325, partial [Bacteroidales bacterium]|nr:hypothetical protein [Bacteroidales bacterium]